MEILRLLKDIVFTGTYGHLQCTSNFQLKWSPQTVAMTRNNITFGHLLLSDNGKFAKIICYFLHADLFGKCTSYHHWQTN